MQTETTSADGAAVTNAEISKTAPTETVEHSPTQTPAKEPEEQPSEPAADKPGVGEKPDTNKRSAAARIRELVQERNAAERRARAAYAEVERLKRPLTGGGENLDFEQQERLRTREALREDKLEDNERQLHQAHEEHAQVTRDTVTARLEAGEEKFPGLVQQAKAIRGLSEETVSYLADSEYAAEITHHLIQNPDVAERLYDLTRPDKATRASVREADRIMAQLEASMERPAARKATTAPNPGTTLAGGKPVGGGKDPETMSDAEYSAWYRERRKARG